MRAATRAASKGVQKGVQKAAKHEVKNQISNAQSNQQNKKQKRELAAGDEELEMVARSLSMDELIERELELIERDEVDEMYLD